MLYADLLMNRLEQACCVLESVSEFYSIKLEQAEVEGDKEKQMEIMSKKIDVASELVVHRAEILELASSRLDVLSSNNPEDLTKALSKHTALLNELNNKYGVFENEEGFKLIM